MDNSKEKIYTGNFVRTFDTFMLIALFIFCCYMLLVCIKLGNNKYWFGFLVWFALFAIFTNKMNYFIITQTELIAKNPIWFWRKIVFDLDSIKSISVVQPSKSPISLEIKTLNKKKVIGATSLRNNTWKKLISDLEKKNISVISKIAWK